MSFASDVKNELLRTENEKNCCNIAELCGIVCFCAVVSYKNGKTNLKISTENASAARRCFALVKKVFAHCGVVESGKSRAGRGGYSYTVMPESDEAAERILSGLHLYDTEFKNHISFRADKELLKKPCCKRAFIRGAFLGGGSVTNPQHSYHLELATHHKLLSEDTEKLLCELGFAPKTILRKSNYVIYFKGGDEIADLLSLTGAYNSMMEFTNIRIIKETRNNVNRKVNCETANLDKTICAAGEQIEAIKKIMAAGRFDSLDERLQTVALLRVENKEASLEDIAKMLTPTLSKSGISHRFKKLAEIAAGIDKTVAGEKNEQ